MSYSTDTNPFRYCGEYYDAETGLIYLRARYYDTDIGRFISEDPIRDGLNWYVYCGNNPVNRIDPNGEDWKDIIYGMVQTIDENSFGGTAKWLSNKLIGDNYSMDSEYDYYLGRVIGDAISVLIGSGTTVAGITEIIGSIAAGGTITIGSGGTLAVGGVTIATEGVAAGTAMVSYGGNVMYMAGKNFSDDYEKLNKIKLAEQKNPSLKKVNNETANAIAQQNGFNKAEDFKAIFVGEKNVSRFNIKIDKNTGEIFLESLKKGGPVIATGYYR